MTNIKAKNHQPVISVIVAVRNGAGYLQHCIDSFAQQDYPDKELVIIDGNSDDGTTEIIESNLETIAYWESKPDRGISHAWNKGLSHINGEWILFLGCDDVLHDPGVFSKFVELSESADKGCKVIYGTVNLIDSNGSVISRPGWDWQHIESVFFSEKMMIPHQACFHHQTVFERYGLFDEEFKIVSDYDLLLRILKDSPPCFSADLIVSDMYFGGVSTRVKTLLAMQKEFDKALTKNGFKPSGYKRFCNIQVYKLINLIIKLFGERVAGVVLDRIRVLIGKKPVWTINR